jgi:hypothetical protein
MFLTSTLANGGNRRFIVRPKEANSTGWAQNIAVSANFLAFCPLKVGVLARSPAARPTAEAWKIPPPVFLPQASAPANWLKRRLGFRADISLSGQAQVRWNLQFHLEHPQTVGFPLGIGF